jgi:hypothetical protein
MTKKLYDNSDYFVVRGDSLEESLNTIMEYEKEDLAKLIVNNRLNDFISEYANYKDDERGNNHGKRVPYVGWFWRATDFVGGNIPIGDCGDFIGVMENNKWDYPERLLTKEEAEKVTKIVWEAKILSEKGGSVAEIIDSTKAKLEELWDLFQTFKIK